MSDCGSNSARPACRFQRAALLGLCFAAVLGMPIRAGDILRGGASSGARPVRPAEGAAADAATAEARANAKDALARTTAALESMQALQKSAHEIATRATNGFIRDPSRPGLTLPVVPNGLKSGGLEVAPGVPKNLSKPQPGEDASLWRGAQLPRESKLGADTVVTIDQFQQQAILNWRTFNIGKSTRLRVNQDRGGSQKTEWIAFNKVNDPTGNPTQILGKIDAPGQVYVINQNGIIFGGSSQINVHNLTASSLPINDALIGRGLLNQEANKVRFLFSSVGTEAFTLSGGATTITLGNTIAESTAPTLRYTNASGVATLVAGTDYTLSRDNQGKTVVTFTPVGLVKVAADPISATYTAAAGDVTVLPGAQLTAPTTAAKVGGRIALVGPNVSNQGTISTEDGQTILAAGREVGLVEHPSADPTLRGVDAFVGTVNGRSGTATNEGLINVPRGSVTITGKSVSQFGVIESSTSVSLNGRIDLLAQYNALPNALFTPTAKLAPFLLRSTGIVRLGEHSTMRILPELESDETAVGTELALNSQVNFRGRTIYFGTDSSLLAPSAGVIVDAGDWNYLVGAGEVKFVNASGQIFFNPGATINVAGTVDVTIPVTQNFLELQLRGAELADSPLQRKGLLRGADITIDIRNSGTYNGAEWIGTPLGDASGFAGLIQRNVGELTTMGGTVNLNAGGSVVMQPGSTLDVSGGWINFQGALVKTTRVISAGQLFDIAQATPDRVYEGIYTGTFTDKHLKYGVSFTYASPLALLNSRFEPDYVQGADGGAISITAPAVALDGELRGRVVNGSRQKAMAAEASELSLTFQKTSTGENATVTSPTPPRIVFQNNLPLRAAAPFSVDADGNPRDLRADRRDQVVLSPDLFSEAGFGKLKITNGDGDFAVPGNVTLSIPEKGVLEVTGSNIQIDGRVRAPGGKLSFTAYNYSPLEAGDGAAASPFPPLLNRGSFTLATGAELNTAGAIIDQSRSKTLGEALAIDGGEVKVAAYDTRLEVGSVIDVSGGVLLSPTGKRTYGAGGKISISGGQDPLLPGRGSVIGGDLLIGATLKGYSGAKGGMLAVRAPRIQIGGQPVHPGVLYLAPEFFSTGGFTAFDLTGLGALGAAAGEFSPGISIEPGTFLHPIAESYLAVPNPAGRDELMLTTVVKPEGQRTPVSLAFNTPGVTQPNGDLFVRGNFLMSPGSVIVTDPGAGVTINGQTVAIFGSITAPAGSISVTGASSYPLAVGVVATRALPTVYIASSARLSAAGTTVLQPDAFERRIGTVLGGGTISVAGNVVADAGAVLDVSGTSGLLDLSPANVDQSEALNGRFEGGPLIPSRSGLNAPLTTLATVRTRVDSDGGSITLRGTQELFTDATLLGRAGGTTALGGTLTISSGRFYTPSDQPALPDDRNLVVTQGGLTRPQTASTVNDTPLGEVQLGRDGLQRGYFTANRFLNGGFDSLNLRGNVEFNGPVTIFAPRDLTVADGGVIYADSRVTLSAAHAVLGTPFNLPLPGGQQAAPFTNAGLPYGITPTFGPGRLTVSADLIEIGNLALKNIGNTTLMASGGEIRGNGTLDVAGYLRIHAGQIYPITAGQFNLVARDYSVGGNTRLGSITITSSGLLDLPLSAGGQLGVFASTIEQGGVLRAPGGSIQIGWEDAATLPFDILAQAKVPITQRVTLAAGSVTSVSLVDPRTGEGAIIPFGRSTDGSNWIDPTGLDVSAGGLAQKKVGIAGLSVSFDRGATVDLSGGGDLYAYRFVKGNGGSTDLLAWNFTGGWTAGAAYSETQIVSYQGASYYARTNLTAADNIAPPAPGPMWKQVMQSFAVLSKYSPSYAPVATFNSTTDPGFTRTGLNVGDRIYLGDSERLRAGNYTLLPARYALLPGAFLLTPQTSTLPLFTTRLPDGTSETSRTGVRTASIGTFDLPEGSSLVPGFRYNDLNGLRRLLPRYTQFEISGADVFRERVEYADYFANSFLTQRAQDLEIDVQRLPGDAGYLRFEARTGMRLDGRVLASGVPRFHDGLIDISSTGADLVIGGKNTTAAPGQILLNASRLGAFGAESLVIGGLRTFGTDGVKLKVTTDNVILDNAGSPLRGADIVIAANKTLTVEAGAKVLENGRIKGSSDRIFIGDDAVPGSGDGVLIRVSSDPGAQVIREGVNNANNVPQLTIKGGTLLAGASITLDSTSGTSLDPNAKLDADTLSLNSGQIIIQLDPNVAVPATGLVLGGSVLKDLSSTRSLSLLTYRSLDVYGSGEFNAAGSLTLHAAEIRGFGNGGGNAKFTAGSITLDNRSGNVGPGADPGLGGALSGTLEFDTTRFRIGAGDLAISQFQLTDVKALNGLVFTGTGSVSTLGDFSVETAFVTATRGVKNGITAIGDLTFNAPTGGAPATGGGLGAALTMRGAKVVANSDFLLNSGSLTLQATGAAAGDSVVVGGRIDLSGTTQTFFDATRFTSGGDLKLISKNGDISVDAAAVIDVSAPVGGADAGSVSISVPRGQFMLGGKLLGKAGAGGVGGSFALDVRELPSNAAVSTTLNDGGFTNEQAFRVRTGNVALDGDVTARTFRLSADGGDITVTKKIDASGATGGRIDLLASGDLVLENGAVLTVAAERFNNAGKGGSVTLEAGAQIDGAVDYTGGATLQIMTGSTIDLSVAQTAAPELGKFAGVLHLRASQTADGLNVNIAPVAGTITGASAIIVEGYRLWDLQQGGQLTKTGGTTQELGGAVTSTGVNLLGSVNANGTLFAGNTAAINGALFQGANAGLASLSVVTPGAELINRNGDLMLGTASTTTSAGDWDLASSRFGPNGVAGVLTLRASGDLLFLNALSDGFVNSTFNSQLLARNPNAPTNVQSWSYRLTAGADVTAADFGRVLSETELAPNKGSLLLGKTTQPSGATTNQVVPRLFQVIRTGSGDIEISTGRDIHLRNLFSNVYTAGVRLPNTDATLGGTFDLPRVKPTDGIVTYQPQYSLAGGNVSLNAQGNIRRTALLPSGLEGSQAQLPINWLHRRGAVGPDGTFIASPIGATASTFGELATTSWWIDFSNFFEGIGALGGGNVSLVAGGNIENVDAVIPTNARMPGRDTNGILIAADPTKLIELGGGDLTVRAGGNIDGGVYYLERGDGKLRAGGAIKTNATRNTIVENVALSSPENYLPTSLFLGKGSFDVGAQGDLLLGPIANPFLLPLAFNNGFSYKTFFSTYGLDSAVNVSSLGGSVTMRTVSTPPLDGSVGTSLPILQQWTALMRVRGVTGAVGRQQWLNIGEATPSSGTFVTGASLLPGTLKISAASGDINVVGALTLSPAPRGTLELLAGGSVNGLQPSGKARINGSTVTVWTSSRVNLSDADPAAIPGISTPLAYQIYVAATPGLSASSDTLPDFVRQLDSLFTESGSTTLGFSSKQALHGQSLLHEDDQEPLRVYSVAGNLADFTLFSGKPSRFIAGRDITDISLYLQNLADTDVSLVSAGRDLVAYSSGSPLRTAATSTGNVLADSIFTPNTGQLTIPDSEAGDIQIGGPGTLEILAGRDLDLGAGLNRADGTGTGVTSIGNGRNPGLPFAGASVVLGAGLGPAVGLANSALDFEGFAGDGSELFDRYQEELVALHPELKGLKFEELNAEQKSLLSLDVFYLTLRDSGRANPIDPAATGAAQYAEGQAAIETLLQGGKFKGNISTQSRDIRTRNGGNISILAPGGGLTLSTVSIGNPAIPPGVVTESGGAISIFTDGDVNIGISRIFTLRGGDIIIWSSNGDIAAGSSSKTVKSAPPTRVLVDLQSADVKTDLAGLATGGGIGVLATVAGVGVGDVDLIAPTGTVDAGDAGIRATGNLNIAAVTVLNADNIQVGGSSSGVPATAPPAAPSLSVVAPPTNATTASAGPDAEKERERQRQQEAAEPDSEITVEIIGSVDEAVPGETTSSL